LDWQGHAPEILSKLPRQHVGAAPLSLENATSCLFQALFNLKLHAKKGTFMNKADLINEVASVVSNKTEAQAAVDCVLESIVKTLKNGDVVTLVGFGSFKVVKRKARTGRNPQTGAEIQISASNVPKFVPGKAFKDAVN
jgi:nucleoid DNA-binding protein